MKDYLLEDSSINSKNKHGEMQWTTVIQSRSGWFNLNLSELWQYRDLIALFVRRNFVATYKQTILGPIWFLLQPLITTLIFSIVFGNIAGIPTDGLPQILFYMAGIVSWNYFASSLTKTSDTFIANSNIFGKVYFPRLSIPLANVITNLLTFVIQFILFLGFISYFYLKGSDIQLTWWIILTPLLVIQMAALGLGFGIIVSSLTTKYRDLIQLVNFGVQLWMYATPIVYPLSQIPSRWQWVFILNPMAPVVEFFRFAFLGAGAIKLWQLGLSMGVTAVVLILGIILFSRIEKTFMDTI